MEQPGEVQGQGRLAHAGRAAMTIIWPVQTVRQRSRSVKPVGTRHLAAARSDGLDLVEGPSMMSRAAVVLEVRCS